MTADNVEVWKIFFKILESFMTESALWISKKVGGLGIAFLYFKFQSN